MKRWICCALSVVPLAATAQAPNSLSAGFGFRLFGTRLTAPGAAHEYANSMELELRGERAISRRFGIMIAGMVAPNSAQKTNQGVTGTFGLVRAYGGELALSFRFKPIAPIYFYAGGAFMRFSRFADRADAREAASEFGTALGMGMDQPVTDGFNVRFQLAWNLMHPDDPPAFRSTPPDLTTTPRPGVLYPTPNTAKSRTTDFRFSLAVRRTFQRR
jgi:hypothetical protein